MTVIAGAEVAQAPNLSYVESSDTSEAERRAKEAVSEDPFPDVPAALLSSEHIQAYVRQTAMLHPFRIEGGALKAASYEIRPGGQYILWDNNEKTIQQVEGCTEIVLPANSISFVQLESTIRLPNYIAMRFNLRIKHVHRGILLGTGPLVDPGYHGQLLIPLHNLTAAPYRIRTDEGLIWAEFTKTSWAAGKSGQKNVSPIDAEFFPTDPSKTSKPIEYYFEKASQNRPIQSSIPEAIRTAKDESSKARKDAEEAKRSNQFFAGLGLFAVLSLVVSLYSFIQTAYSNQKTSGDKALAAEDESRRALDNVGALAGRMKAIEDLFPQRRSVGDVDGLSRRLNDLERQMSSIRSTLEASMAAGRQKKSKGR